jgi:hypothetical protein
VARFVRSGPARNRNCMTNWILKLPHFLLLYHYKKNQAGASHPS